jgi:integrase
MYYKKIPMFKINFYLRGAEKAKADTTCSIYYQLEIEGRNRDTPVSTRLKVPKRYWKNSRVTSTYIWAEHINNNLDQIARSYKDIYAGLSIQNQSVTYHELREHFDPISNNVKQKPKKSFFDTFDAMVAAKKLDAGTQRNYSIRRKNLQIFFNQINIPHPLITDIKYKHIEQLIKKYEDVWGNDHLNKHAQAIKQTLEYALKNEYIKFNPIGKLSLKNSEIKPPKYLTPDLRQKINGINYPSLTKIKDISIFLWNTGLSYTDYLSLNSLNITHTEDGLWFKKQRGKSKIFSLIPILEEAAAIIEKYGTVEALPRPDLSDFNKELKYLGDFTGINQTTVGWNLSSSVFRETFCSIMENEFMLDERTVMFMMGHRTRKQVNNYSHVMPSRIAFELKKANLRIFEPKPQPKQAG